MKPADSNDALDGGLEGRDMGVRPKFYVEYDTQVDAIKREIKPLSSLERRHQDSVPLIAESRRSRGFWTALVDRRSGYPVKYLPIDPY